MESQRKHLPKPLATLPIVGTRPETGLLLCCARNGIDSEKNERVRALIREGMDWEYLIRTAALHGMRPLLSWTLHTTCPEAVPKSILNRLRDQVRAVAGRNLFLATELIKVLTLFETAGIPAIPFKGPFLAASVYGNLTLREFCDLDILIHRDDVVRAKGLLTSQGYRVLMQPNGAREAADLQSNYHYGFVRGDGGVAVELHWEIAERRFSFPPDAERVWDRAQPVSFLGRTVLSFSAEDLLLILCVHGAKHCWRRLGWIYDVAELIYVHQGMDWGRAIEHARSVGSGRILLLGLLLAGTLLGNALPQKVLKGIHADRAVGSLVEHVRRRLFQEIERSELLEANLEANLFHLRLRERLRDRVPYFLHIAMSPNESDRKFLSLPSSLNVLYYPVRVCRLIGNYGLHPHKLGRHALPILSGILGRL